MTPDEMAAERELHKERIRKQAAEHPHETRPALPMHFGKRKKYDHDYVPPDDLNTSHRRCR